MTMLDDDVLASLFARTGASFDVPKSGPSEILARAGQPRCLAAPPAGAHRGDDLDAVAISDDADEAGGGVGTEPVPLAGARAGRTRRLVATAHRHRILSVAASIVVVLAAATVGTLVRPMSSRTMTSGLAKAPVQVAWAHAGATTTPPGHTPAGAAGRAASPTQGGTSSRSVSSGTSPTPPRTAPTTPTTVPSLPADATGRPAKIEQTGTLGLTVGHQGLDRTMMRPSVLAGVYGGFVATSETQGRRGALRHRHAPGPGGQLLGRARARGVARQDSQPEHEGERRHRPVRRPRRGSPPCRTAACSTTGLSKATSVGDILSVQEQIGTIQSQIEQLQGQLNVLTSETSYSTLTVNVNETTPSPRPVPLPESGLVQAWHDSAGRFVAGVEGLVRVAGPLLFALLLLGLVLTGGRVLWRRYQRHRL